LGTGHLSSTALNQRREVVLRTLGESSGYILSSRPVTVFQGTAGVWMGRESSFLPH
jgi:hypothetical protein